MLYGLAPSMSVDEICRIMADNPAFSREKLAAFWEEAGKDIDKTAPADWL